MNQSPQVRIQQTAQAAARALTKATQSNHILRIRRTNNQLLHLQVLMVMHPTIPRSVRSSSTGLDQRQSTDTMNIQAGKYIKLKTKPNSEISQHILRHKYGSLAVRRHMALLPISALIVKVDSFLRFSIAR
jgi:hypothetical protein